MRLLTVLVCVACLFVCLLATTRSVGDPKNLFDEMERAVGAYKEAVKTVDKTRANMKSLEEAVAKRKIE